MKIIKSECRTMGRDEALSFIRNAKKSRFIVRLGAFLPTTEGRGFEGSTALTVSRPDMLRAVGDMLSETLEKRGAKVTLHIDAPDYDGGYAYISVR